MKDTITMNEIRATNTWSVKDDSPRGCKTVSNGEVKPGDKVVYENRFTLVIDDPETEEEETTKTGGSTMTNRTEKTYRVADITAEDIKKAIECQDAYPTPDAYMYYRAEVVAQSEDERDPYSKDWTKEEFDDCPEVREWLKAAGAEDWTAEDVAGHVVNGEEIQDAFERSAVYLEGLEEIADDIKKDFESETVITIEPSPTKHEKNETKEIKTMTYQRKTVDRWDILTNYGYGWECECSEYTPEDAQRSYKEYRDNVSASARVKLIKRREKKQTADR